MTKDAVWQLLGALAVTLTVISVMLWPVSTPYRYLDGRDGDVFYYPIHAATEIRFMEIPNESETVLIVENPKHFPLYFPKGLYWAGNETPTMTKGTYSVYRFFHFTGDDYAGWAQTNLCGELPHLTTECP